MNIAKKIVDELTQKIKGTPSINQTQNGYRVEYHILDTNIVLTFILENGIITFDYADPIKSPHLKLKRTNELTMNGAISAALQVIIWLRVTKLYSGRYSKHPSHQWT